MQLLEKIVWINPLHALQNLKNEPELVWLHSAMNEYHTGRYSFLAWGLMEAISTSRWAEIEAHLSANRPWIENAWFGWLGYGMRLDSETLARGTPSPINCADAYFMRFHHMLRIDHHAQCTEYYSDTTPDMRWNNAVDATSIQGVIRSYDIASPMNKTQYIDCVTATKNEIEKGEFYQANITRKFTGRLDNNFNILSLINNLLNISPSPYFSYIKVQNTAIISSSPECFLTIDASGKILSRPIKGSAPRGESEAADAAIKTALLDSAKDHAENRMIVDLVRNDMARVSVAGSVKVEESAHLMSYATVHHLISSIASQKHSDISTLRAVQACFPAGSMTGAPKIAAMKWCAAQETLERGIYSGAIGWFGGDGACDLSVVIRTIVIEDSRFEFQVGGGIVADSTPELEWHETLIKARGIAKALGIDETTLEAL